MNCATATELRPKELVLREVDLSTPAGEWPGPKLRLARVFKKDKKLNIEYYIENVPKASCVDADKAASPTIVKNCLIRLEHATTGNPYYNEATDPWK